jgi:hypothetical protein
VVEVGEWRRGNRIEVLSIVSMGVRASRPCVRKRSLATGAKDRGENVVQASLTTRELNCCEYRIQLVSIIVGSRDILGRACLVNVDSALQPRLGHVPKVAVGGPYKHTQNPLCHLLYERIMNSLSQGPRSWSMPMP